MGNLEGNLEGKFQGNLLGNLEGNLEGNLGIPFCAGLYMGPIVSLIRDFVKETLPFLQHSRIGTV